LARGMYAVGLLADGRVFHWSRYPGGSLQSAPQPITSAVSIAANQYAGLAVRQDGTVGLQYRSYPFPASVPAYVTNIVSVAPGVDHAVALRSDGTVVAWGGSYGTDVPPGLSNVALIAAGLYW